MTRRRPARPDLTPTRLPAPRALPAIAREEIDAPIVIAGPARSGTTILHELLWLDPDARSPLGYEALQPAPPDSFAGELHRQVAECEQELWSDVQPEFAAIHELPRTCRWSASRSASRRSAASTGR
jgi:hypothetical protein